jgi:hypothetical protein
METLAIWKGHGILLDGHQRYVICNEHSVPFRTRMVDLPDRNHAMLWILEQQLGRKNLSDDQCAMLEAGLLESEQKISTPELSF